MPPETGGVLEHLIIITGKDPDETLRRLQQHYKVTQIISKKVFLVRGDSSNLTVAEPEGLHIFSTTDIPEGILSSLDEKESLFVSAWRSRLQQPPKKRKGEGLDWDHPEFKPPR